MRTERVNLDRINHVRVLLIELIPSNKALYNPKSTEEKKRHQNRNSFSTYFIGDNSIRH
jgi:hypothetical protein